MITPMKSCLFACVFAAAWGVSPSISTAESTDPIVASVTTATERLGLKPLDERENEISLAWDYALSRNDTPTAVLGIVSLWKKDRRALVELAWWRQRDSAVRKAILLLFYALTKVEADNFPRFEDYAVRFETTESASRTKEIDEVKASLVKNRAAVQGVFPRSSR